MRIGQQYGETDTGRKRRRNEDAFVCDPPLFAVADGMGGAQAGEVASALAAGALRERGDSDAGGEAQVVELIQEANRRVHQRALDDTAVTGMGTTMTVALVADDGTIAFGHVGDSRAYRLRDGELRQLTDDHSLVAELVRRGELSPEQAETHPQRSVITRALGTDPDVDVDAFTVDTRPGDLFLLCSDGLTTMVDADGIAALVALHRDDLAGATRALIAAANDHGGDDNITAVLFDIADGPAGDGALAAAPAAAALDPDEADTLHPEDHVAAPVVEAAAPVAATAALEPPAERERVEGDTRILSPEAIRAALAGGAAAETAPEAEAEPAPEYPPDPETETGAEAAPELPPDPEAEAEADGEPEVHVPLWRMLLAIVVIVGLAAAVVLLVTQGLAR